MAEEQKKQDEAYELIDIPTSSIKAVKHPDGKVYDLATEIILLRNEFEQIKKLIG